MFPCLTFVERHPPLRAETRKTLGKVLCAWILLPQRIRFRILFKMFTPTSQPDFGKSKTEGNIHSGITYPQQIKTPYLVLLFYLFRKHLPWQTDTFCLLFFTFFFIINHFLQGYGTACNLLKEQCPPSSQPPTIHSPHPPEGVLNGFINLHPPAVTRPSDAVLGPILTVSNGTKAVCLHHSLTIKYYLLQSSHGSATRLKLLQSKSSWQRPGWSPKRMMQKVPWNLQNSQAEATVYTKEHFSWGGAWLPLGNLQKQTQRQTDSLHRRGCQAAPVLGWGSEPGRAGSHSKVLF